MIDKSLIGGKIKNIEEYIKEIESILSLDTKTILSNIEKIRTLERNFQLIVDTMLDINMHFISEMKLMVPDNFQSTFETISSEAEILPADFAFKIAPVVSLRNRIVHRYEKVDREIFVEQVKKEYQDFIEYIRFINKYLKKVSNH